MSWYDNQVLLSIPLSYLQDPKPNPPVSAPANLQTGYPSPSSSRLLALYNFIFIKMNNNVY